MAEKVQNSSGDEIDLHDRQEERGEALLLKSVPDILVTSPSDRSSFSSEGSFYSDYKYKDSGEALFKAPLTDPGNQFSAHEQKYKDTRVDSTVSENVENFPLVVEAVTNKELDDQSRTLAANDDAKIDEYSCESESKGDGPGVTDKMFGSRKLETRSSISDEQKTWIAGSLGQVGFPDSGASELDIFERTEALLNNSDPSCASGASVDTSSSKQDNLMQNIARKLQEIPFTNSALEKETKDMRTNDLEISPEEIPQISEVHTDNGFCSSTVDEVKRNANNVENVEMQPILTSKQPNDWNVPLGSSEEIEMETMESNKSSPSISHSSSLPSSILSQIKEYDMTRSHSFDSLTSLQSVRIQKGNRRFAPSGKYSNSPRSGSPLGYRAAALLSELQSQISSFSPHKGLEPTSKTTGFGQIDPDLALGTVLRDSEDSNVQEGSSVQTFDHEGQTPVVKSNRESVEATFLDSNNNDELESKMHSDSKMLKENEPCNSSLASSVDPNTRSRNPAQSTLSECADPGRNLAQSTQSECADPGRNLAQSTQSECADPGRNPAQFTQSKCAVLEHNTGQSTQYPYAALTRSSSPSFTSKVCSIENLPDKGESLHNGCSQVKADSCENPKPIFSLPLFEDLERTSFSMEDSLDFQRNSTDDKSLI